jgi:thioredoxin-dependent peroxiredoxin
MVKVGEKAPDFVGFDQNGNQLGLKDFQGKKIILFFYPKDDTPGCTAEACNLRDNYNMLTSLGFALLGVSPDAQKKHQAFIQKYELPFPLIADTDQLVLKMFGAWGEKKMYGKSYEGVLRTTFIIDENGIVTHVIDKVNTKDHTSQILDLLEG